MLNVDVVFVNYRSEEYLQRAIARLASAGAHGLDVRVWVVDCSGSAGAIDGCGLSLEVLDPGRNIGFGPASNLGARAGSGQILAFVNPDVALDIGAFSDVVRRGAADGAAAWTGTLSNDDGSVQPNAGPPPSLRQLAREYLLGRDTRLPPPVRRREVAVLTGAVLLVDRGAFAAVGGFSPSLPLYMEDVDLSRRLARRGSIVQYPVHVGVHVGGRSARHAAREAWMLLHASRVRYYGGARRRDRVVAAGVVLTGLGLRAVVRERSTLPWLRPLALAMTPAFPLTRLLPGDERASR